MTEIEELINQNQGKKSKLIIQYYNFFKSIEEFKKDKIVNFFISKNLFFDDCFILTDNRVLVLENHYSKGTIVKLNVNLLDIEDVVYKDETLFSGRKLRIKLKNTLEFEFNSFDKEELKIFEKAIVFCLGAIAISSDKEAEAEEWSFKIPTDKDNSNSKSEKSSDVMDDVITQKLTKLKKLFDADLITKEDYEKRKSDLLDLL